MKSNALKGRRFDSLEALAEYLERWNRTVAQVRIHGTTRQQVLRHFLEVEQPLLQPLPSEPFGLFQIGTRSVHPDGHVEVDGAFYSVPHTLVGEQVRAQWDGHLVRIYALATDGERRLVAVHLRVRPGTYSTKPEHRPLHRPARQAAYEAILLGKAEHIGPQALAAFGCSVTLSRQTVVLVIVNKRHHARQCEHAQAGGRDRQEAGDSA